MGTCTEQKDKDAVGFVLRAEGSYVVTELQGY